MAFITFCGAAGTVTGSCSFVEADAGKFLVDCGLFQGSAATRELNEGPFPFEPSEAQFLVLTHAHIDHSGLLPKLVKEGFSGPIYGTPPTIDLLRFMLLDSAYIQESNAERKNRDRQRRGVPLIEPAYTIADAKQTLSQMEAVEYETWHTAVDGAEFRFFNAGHLLGSASAEFKVADSKSPNTLRLLFSGDLGPEEKAFHPEPDAPEGYDYIVCESTYGDRERDDYTLEERRKSLKAELLMGLDRGGNVVIPSFAVERSQELLHDIGVLLSEGLLPNATVFLDSPLARKATEVFVKYSSDMEDIELDESELFRHEQFHIVESVDESKAINQHRKGAIIISASGMCNAGRIKHHLKNNIWRKECSVLFVGYQSPGTLGHIIRGGAKQVRIHGKHCKVRAAIRSIGNYSAHADQSELIRWIVERSPIAGGLFLNHGDDDARGALADLVAAKGIDRDSIYLPQFDERFELVAASAEQKGRAQSTGRVVERLADPKVLSHDWHNDYAAFILELADQLEQLGSEQERSDLLSKLQTMLPE
ncbi:MAG: MBL fold metallo-hydrolase RNA specificity domain-containing protein [Pirellulaceae bacterium]